MMECSSFKDDSEFTSPQTLVLVGRTGNEKIATGNSILRTNAFRSEHSLTGVTSTTELGTTELKDGQMLNVIDTPGLFDSSVSTEFIVKEIVSCINMAGDGIHAFLVVLSVRCHFSKEEEAAINTLLTLFGRKMCDYMIVVFTGGDLLEKDGVTLEDFICECPGMLKEILSLSGNRHVLFDNKTKDQTKISDQVHKLLSFVNMVSVNNGGKPYTNEMFTELKSGTTVLRQRAEECEALKEITLYSEQKISKLTDHMHEEQFKRIFEMVEQKLRVTTLSLERQLEEEQAAREKAEEDAKAVKEKLDEQKRSLTQQLEMAVIRQEEHQRLDSWFKKNCVIL